MLRAIRMFCLATALLPLIMLLPSCNNDDDGDSKATLVTPLPTSLPGISDPDTIQPFLDDLSLITGRSVTFEGQSSTAFADVADGTRKFGFGLASQSGIPAMALYYSMPFGMEGQEFVAWYYEAGGRELERDIFENANTNVVPIAFRVAIADGGGWFREVIGSNGDYFTDPNNDVRMRLFGLGGEVLVEAYPNVTVPAASGGASPLEDFESGHFSDIEFGFPTLDKALFFDGQTAGNTIADAGAEHYYLGCWWQPYVYTQLWINRDFWENLSDAQQQRIELAARANVIRSMAESNVGQGPAVAFFQDQGVTIHESWPENVLDELRAAAITVLNEKADDDSEFERVLESIRDFAQDEQTRWGHAHVKRADRFDWTDWESVVD